MSYVLRLFEDGVEVHSSTVAIVPSAQNYPAAGQTIDDKWLVTDVISHDDKERCLRVGRL
jgi:hypothetical protein